MPEFELLEVVVAAVVEGQGAGDVCGLAAGGQEEDDQQRRSDGATERRRGGGRRGFVFPFVASSLRRFVAHLVRTQRSPPRRRIAGRCRGGSSCRWGRTRRSGARG